VEISENQEATEYWKNNCGSHNYLFQRVSVLYVRPECFGEIRVSKVDHYRHRSDIEEFVKREEKAGQSAEIFFKRRKVFMKGPSFQDWTKRLQQKECDQEDSDRSISEDGLCLPDEIEREVCENPNQY